MKNINIQLTDKEVYFLKEFAAKHYDGAEDDLYTANAIHVVETYRPRYIPYHEDQVDYFGHLDLQFTTDQDYELWHNTEVEAIEEWYEIREEEIPIELKSFNELQYKEVVSINNEEIFVLTYEDYFKVYGIDWFQMVWLEDNYEPIAFFFIRDEAKRYLEYQKHNLRRPRIYTYSSGYANYGDFNYFRDLLLKIGTQLNEESGKIAN